MSILNLIKVGTTCLVAGIAVGAAYQSYCNYRQAKAISADMKRKNALFEAELEQSLYEIGGAEMVAEFKRRCAEA